jgi:hypothetical protein
MATIWGYNKNKLARCYALNIPNSEVEEFLKKARAEGWSGLVVDRKPQPTLWGEEAAKVVDDALASSAAPKSRRSKRASSGTSDDASKSSDTTS